MKLIDLKGKKFNRLTVLEYIGKSKWLCKCDCGNLTTVIAPKLKSGHTKSCGCYNKEKVSERMKEIAKQNFTKHHKCSHNLYIRWQAMKRRCETEHYKKKGITICEQWESNFENFYNWAINNGYKKELSLDRINNNDGYYPNNCRWTNRITQANNTSRNIYLEYNNEIHTISEWSKISKLSYQTIIGRLKRGWKINDIFNRRNK